MPLRGKHQLPQILPFRRIAAQLERRHRRRLLRCRGQWLKDQKKNDPTRFKRILNKVKRLAESVKYKTFLSTWKDYDKFNPESGPAGNAKNVLSFNGQDTKLRCGEYLCNEYGNIYRESEIYGNVLVCSHPIMPTKRIVNADNGKAKMEVDVVRKIEPYLRLACEVSADGVLVTLAGEGDLALALPVFDFDGERKTDIRATEKAVDVSLDGWTCRYETNGELLDTGLVYGNRNGHYRRYEARRRGPLSVKVTLAPLSR